MRRYPPSTIHRYLDLPSTQRIQSRTSHRHNTTPPLHTLVQAPYLLPTYITHTIATKTQTHDQHSHTPPTPHIPRTTLIHNTSAALDTIPEPRVPPTCHALTTTHAFPTPVFLSTSHHHTLSTDTHATQTTVYASQSQQQRRPHAHIHNTRIQTQQ